jgi:hypothetical protein
MFGGTGIIRASGFRGQNLAQELPPALKAVTSADNGYLEKRG